MRMDVDVEKISSDEEFVIEQARQAFKKDPIIGKAWIITAKTLYPNNFGVQFEAYRMERDVRNVQEAARNFSDLIGKFSQQGEFWSEVNKVTSAVLLREVDSNDQEKQFYHEMFKCMKADDQRQFLLITAEHCDDTIEHCRLLLLLLQKFSSSIQNHALKLIETLLSAEKHSLANTQPINPYRKMLVYELAPLLLEKSVEIPQKLLIKVLHKAIECYLHTLNSNNSGQKTANLDDSWQKVCIVLQLAGKQLGWDPSLTCFDETWTKDHYYHKLITFCQSHSANLEEPGVLKQLLYCFTIFCLHCLHEYKISLNPEAHPGQVQTLYLLVEAFAVPSAELPVESQAKRQKTDTMLPTVTIEKNEVKNILNNFTLTRKCWELLNSFESLKREFVKLNTHLKLNTFLNHYLVDYTLFKGEVDEGLALLRENQNQYPPLINNLRCASFMYAQKNYLVCYNHILTILEYLPTTNQGCLSSSLTVTISPAHNQRHLHFLPVTRHCVLQYCTKLLLSGITQKAEGMYRDVAVGTISVLSQFDWIHEGEKIKPLLELVRQRGTFQYYLFQNYVVNIDILEEVMHLFTQQVTLDILPHLAQRRMGTRGADKGVKEEVRQAIKRQVARSNDPLDVLIVNFMLNEREIISQCLV